MTVLEQKPQPVSEKFNLFHRYLLRFVKQWFYYSALRACKLYTDDHYQTATKNVLPFIRNSKLCMCYKILFWPAVFQRFFPSSALGPVFRASHIAQEPTGSFPTPILSSALFILNFCVVFIISEMISFKNILLIKIWAIHNFHINTFFKNKHFVKIRNFQTMQLHLLIPPHSGPSLVYPVLNSLVNQHDFNTEHC